MNTENIQLVKVYYCRCGKSIERASLPDSLTGSDISARAAREDFKHAEKNGRKIGIITIEEYHNTPFMECDYE